MPEPPRRPLRKPKPNEFRKIKRLQPKNKVLEIIKTKQEEWQHLGKAQEYKKNSVFWEDLVYFLKLTRKRKSQIMVIGPGKGEDIIKFNEEVAKLNMHPEIDVFGLTKSLSSNAEKIIRTDFSQYLALETLGANPEKYPELVNALKGKYDALISILGAGYHTNFPAQNCFFMALMLNVDGRAVIQIDNRILVRTKPPSRYSNIEMLGGAKYFRPLVNKVLNVFPKLVAIYNKLHKTNYRFEIEELYGVGCIRIKQIS